ncbi:MAG: beta-L-arabinofuranosidase domain-containing protein, partial [Armatimonadia bacterium]
GRQILPLTGDAWALWVTAEDGTVYSSAGETVSRCEVIEAGPMRAIVRRVGRLKAVQGGRDFLEYDLTEEFYANSGVVRVQPVLTHKEASAEEKLSRVRFLLTMGAQAIWMDGQRVDKGGLLQKDDQTAEFTGVFEGKEIRSDKKRFAGQVRLVGKGMTMDLVPRWFWQMYPKSVAATPGGIDLSLVAADKEKPFVLHQGQAIWNDFALAFSQDAGEPPALLDGQQQASPISALASPAVATAEPGYVASTLALGEFAAADEALFPEYEQSVESVYKGYMSKREARREYGVENFGDDTFEWGYGPSYTFWSNQEYDHHYGMLMQFLRSGDYRWWEIADQGSRHYRDVDCYHWAPGREYLVGAPHHHNTSHIVEKGWVADHTVAGAHNSHSWVEGVIAYYFMTGDPRSYEVYNAMGDWYCYTVANNQYGAGGQERGPGWTLVALSALYDATYEEKYREAGSKVIDWVRSVQDPVRGVISVPISEQPSYEGGTAFMHGIVARGAGRWYEATGDPRAKEAVLGIADWLTTEAMGPNALFYYKQAPTQKHGYSASEWQCFTALSYAARYGDQQWYGPLTEEHYNQGRAGTRSIAWAPQSLGHLLPYFTPIRVRLVTPQAVLSPDQPAEIKLQVVNTTDKALAVEVKGLAVPAGLTLEGPAKATLEPSKVTEMAWKLSAKKGEERTGEVRLEIKAGETRREYALPVKVVAKLVQVEMGAGEGKAQAPFVVIKQTPPAVGVVRDATFTGNPRQPGERAGWVEWQVSVPVDGVYYFGAECFWPDDKGNSFFLQVDDGPEAVFGNDGVMGRWHWLRHAGGVRMEAGQHVVRLVNREDGGQVRRIVVTNVEGRLGN